MNTRSSRLSASWLSALLLVLLGASSASGVPDPTARIVVSPDFLVSRDGDNAHVELHIAANPRRVRNLVGSAITHTRADGTPATKVYTTVDGGRSWHDVSFPERRERGGGDPQVAFTPSGTAVFATLATAPDESTGATRAFLHVYRSEDGGMTWSGPSDLGASYDHEMITVDRGTGRFAGRIYLSALYGRSYKLGLFRSVDEGRTFVGPVEFFEAGGTDKGANVLPMAVFRDGALLATFHDFPLGPERSDPGPRRSGFFTVISEDGGVSFSEPQPGPDEIYPSYETEEIRLAGDAGIAIDTSGRYPDRVYRVWNDARSGPFRLWITTSDDRGVAWSEPHMVAPVDGADVQQFLPAIAVGPDGVLGVAWNDTRDSGQEHGFRRWFTASLDGGVTFLPPAPVSSEVSRPYGPGNLAFTPTVFVTPSDEGAKRVVLLSAAGRWGNGGDYAAMAVDADGTFHPFWADARSGTYQIWTARVRVEETEEDTERPTPMPSPRTSHADAGELLDVTDRVELLFDPTRITEDDVVELRIRLKNVTDAPIAGPITLTIRKFGSGMGDEWREWTPEVLNADNGAAGDGATFALDAELGTTGALRHGEVSGPVVIRMRLANPRRVPDLHVVVSGRVAR